MPFPPSGGDTRIKLISSGNLRQPKAGDIINIKLGKNIVAGGYTVLINKGAGFVTLTTSVPYTLQAADVPPLNGNWPLYPTAADIGLRGDTIAFTNPPRVPGAPTIGTAVAGNGQAAVLWAAPLDNGGSAISLYTVQVIDAQGNVIGTQTTTQSPYPATGLVNGVPVAFRVAATNAVGMGPFSALSNYVTPVPIDIVSWLYKDIIVGSSSFAAQIGMHDAGRQSILFHNPTPYVLQYNMASDANNVYNQPNGAWVDIPANSQVFVTDAGKPFARGKAFAITGITSNGTIATVTTAAPHNLSNGASVRVQDVTPSGYNGAFPNITVTGANTFTYPLATTLANTTVPGTWAGRPLTGFTAQTKAIK